MSSEVCRIVPWNFMYIMSAIPPSVYVSHKQGIN